MSVSAIRNLPTFFIPSLVVLPTFSSHNELLLNEWVPRFFAEQQAIFNESKCIIINQEESNVAIESVRNLQEQLSFGTFGGELQAVLLLRIDQASIPAQNALLKVLEEPPSQTKFFLTASNVDKVLGTIQSRCEVITGNFDIENNDIDVESTIKILADISSGSIREQIELAETYQNKQEAIKITTNILKTLHYKLENSPNDAALMEASKVVLQSIELLEKNVNVKLVMGELFMQLGKMQF